MSEKVKSNLKKLYNFSSSWTGTIIIVLLVIFFVAQAFVIPSGSMKKTLLIGDHLFVKKFAYGIPTPHLPWLEVPVLPDFDGDGHILEGDKPQRGDIVIFRYPPNPAMHYVKRCVATSGDEILYGEDALLIHPENGVDEMLKEYPNTEVIDILGKKWLKNPYMSKHPFIQYDGGKSYKQLLSMSKFKRISMDPIVSPDGIYFYKKIDDGAFFMVGDNRDHSNDSRFWGSVSYKNIVGKPWFIYFSWNDDYIIRWDRMFKTVDNLEESALAR